MHRIHGKNNGKPMMSAIVRHSPRWEKNSISLCCQPKENTSLTMSLGRNLWTPGGSCTNYLSELWSWWMQRSKLKMQGSMRFHPFCSELCQVKPTLQDPFILTLF